MACLSDLAIDLWIKLLYDASVWMISHPWHVWSAATILLSKTEFALDC
jgi:hypothetical protein